MGEPKAKYHFRMIEAKERGYYVTDCGRLIGPKGEVKIRNRGSQRYPTFSTNWGGVQSIPVHKFAAYCFYGNESFKDGLVVRHLDANTENVSRENLVLGTHSENNMDKPKERRIYAAKRARESQGTPRNRRLTPSDVELIRSAYATLTTKKAPNGFTKSLADRFGVSRTVIHRVATSQSYGEI